LFRERAKMAAAELKLLSYANTPDFETIADATFKGVEFARAALHFYAEQTHFHVAVRTEKQRLDRFFRELVRLLERTNVSHGYAPFRLVASLLLAAMDGRQLGIL
jgi:hypothetical protein